MRNIASREVSGIGVPRSRIAHPMKEIGELDRNQPSAWQRSAIMPKSGSRHWRHRARLRMQLYAGRRDMTNQETPENVEPVTQSDMEAFARKLEQWGASLSEKEQALLAILLSQAQAVQPEDVQGFTAQLYGGTSLRTSAVLSPTSTSKVLQPYVARGLGAAKLRSANDAWANAHWIRD
jgi:hypothetical protein